MLIICGGVKEAYEEKGEIAEIAGQARDEGRGTAHRVPYKEGQENARLLSGLLNSYKPTDSNNS